MEQAEKFSGTQRRLTHYLEQLTKEELREFQILVPQNVLGKSSSTVIQKGNGMEVASHLVAQYGDQKAWHLALSLWKQMGLKRLYIQAQKEMDMMSGTSNLKTSTLLAPAVMPKHDIKSSKHYKRLKVKEIEGLPVKSGPSWEGNPFLFVPQTLQTPSPADHKWTGQESPSPSTSTAVYGDQKLPPKANPEPGKEKPVQTKCSVKTSKTHQTESILKRNQKQVRKKRSLKQSRENKYLLREFTQLLLLSKPQPRGQEPRDKKNWPVDMAEEGEYFIEIQQLFNSHMATQKEPQIVILHGAAGIGKSTLARQVRGAWEEGQMFRDRFQHVFYFSCRELAQCKLLSLAQLISKDKATPTAPRKQIISWPKKLLFILDGVDEPEWVLEDQNPKVSLCWSQQQPVHALLGSLLGRSTLPEASLLITTRTANLQKLIPSLGQARWIEVLGFSESGYKEYFYKYFSEESQAMRAILLVESNLRLLTLCFVPWVSWLVCTCLKQQMKQGGNLSLNSQTTTALCLRYLSQALPARPLVTQLMSLCSLAAEGIWQRKTLFSAADLEELALYEAVIDTFLEMGILQKHPRVLLYSFTHLFLQEFFAAMSCVLAFNEERKDYIENFRIVERLLELYGPHELFEAPTLHFLFGLLNERGMKEMEKIFNCQLSLERQRELLWRTLGNVQPQQLYSLGFFYCLYEIQDEEFLTQAVFDFQGPNTCTTVDTEHPVTQTNVRKLLVNTDVDLFVVTFCIKFCIHVKRLQMKGSRPQRQALRPPKVVLYRSTPWTYVSWKILFSLSELIKTLEELDLSGNPLSLRELQMLCDTLKNSNCYLKTLWLVRCGLESNCCCVLARTFKYLTEVDLQLNHLDDDGVEQLLNGLRHPACCLKFLWLDQDPLSDEVMTQLRILEAEKPQLIISSIWKPRVMSPSQGLDGGEMDLSMSLFKQPRSPSGDKYMKPFGTEDDFWGSVGLVAPEVIDKHRKLYRVHFPMAGSYHWPNTGLRFVVRSAVTIEIEFCAWCQFLNKTPLQNSHAVAGPLFDIRAEKGAVATVHLPHFVALQEGIVDTSLFEVAHFKEEGMVLEKPVKMEQCYAVLENPSFSPIGMILKMISNVRRIFAVSCITLLYYHLNDKEVTFHLYLIPNDCTIRKAIDEEEAKFQFVRIHKPPPVSPLCVGSCYIVSGSKNMEIIPLELELCYRSPGEAQLFSEICVDHLDSGITLEITDKKSLAVVWKALLKPGDLRPMSVMVSPTPKDVPAFLLFLDQFRDDLIQRVTSVDSVLDKLYGQVLSEEQYEMVRAEITKPNKMRKLFSFYHSWNEASKEKLYRSLKETHPHLIMDLLEKQASERS